MIRVFSLLIFFEMAAAVGGACRDSCGNITGITYPFGVGTNCSKEGFTLECIGKNLYMADVSGRILVLGIFLSRGELRIGSNVSVATSLPYNVSWGVALPSTGPFTVSSTRNSFTAIGCGVLASFYDPATRKLVSMCASVCEEEAESTSFGHGSCSGISCCQTAVPEGVRQLNIGMGSLNQTPQWAKGLEASAFVVEKDWYSFNPADLSGSGRYSNLAVVPMVLDWTVGELSCENATGKPDYACVSTDSHCYNSLNGVGYRCNCSDGFSGNPYLRNGCKDINECEDSKTYPCFGVCINKPGTYDCRCPEGAYGDPKVSRCATSKSGTSVSSDMMTGIGIGLALLVVVLAFMWVYKKFKARKAEKLKQKFFKKNRGQLLEQLIHSNKDVADGLRIFTLKELQKATDHFDRTRVVGRGGHGTVYKSILADQRVVAIKKSKITVQREIDQFINEVAILSQINHRNIVKLYGCCLETEVPLLVYEFISNGTLSKHLQSTSPNDSLAWEDRLRIAVEIARALSYIHSSASISIFHRDVKSTNVLMDVGMNSKLSDFGASRLVPFDHSRVSTTVQGTFGYFDPEYFQTGRLSEKSDVYSFGVILVELITGKQALIYNTDELQEGTSLANEFIRLMKENKVYEILDTRIVQEAKKEEIDTVAVLAEMSLRLTGDERPTMKEVEVQLEELRVSAMRRKHSAALQIAALAFLHHKQDRRLDLDNHYQ